MKLLGASDVEMISGKVPTQACAKVALTIFLLKSMPVVSIWPCLPLGPLLTPPIFLALNADLSAWSNVSDPDSTS